MIIKEMLAENKQKCLERADKLPELSAAKSVPEGTCPLAWCLELVKAARAEACGKSVMCRDGLWQLQLMIEGCMKGQSGEEDLEVMKETLDAMEMVGCPHPEGGPTAEGQSGGLCLRVGSPCPPEPLLQPQLLL